jgi:hypothetical protein
VTWELPSASAGTSPRCGAPAWALRPGRRLDAGAAPGDVHAAAGGRRRAGGLPGAGRYGRRGRVVGLRPAPARDRCRRAGGGDRPAGPPRRAAAGRRRRGPRVPSRRRPRRPGRGRGHRACG